MFHLFICFVREGQLREQHHKMTSQAHAQNLQKSKLAEKEISLESREKVLETRERKSDVFEKQLETRENHVEEREREVQRRTKEMNERDAKVRTQEEELNDGMRNYMEQERRYTSSLPSSLPLLLPLIYPLPPSYPPFHHHILLTLSYRCASTVDEAAHALDKLEQRVHIIKGEEAALAELRAQLLAREREVKEKEERFKELVKQDSGILFIFHQPLLLFSSRPLLSPPLLLFFHLLFFFFFFFFDLQLLMPAKHKCYNRKRRK